MKNFNDLKQLAMETLRDEAERCETEDDLRDLVGELADGLVPVYYNDLTSIYAEAMCEIEDALTDYIDNCGKDGIAEKVKDGGITALISLGVYWYLDNYLSGNVSTVWEDVNPDGEEEEED
jgi:hypothetical protein